MWLANIISRVFDPPVVGTLVLILAFTKSALPAARALPLGLAIFWLIAGIPLVLLVWGIKTGRIKNWDLTERRERIVPIIIEVILTVIAGALVVIWGNSFLESVMVMLLGWMVGFLLITLVWKISGHVAANTLAVGLTLSWLGGRSWALLLLIPLVAWARVKRGDHTAAQAAAGAVWSALVLSVYLLW